MLSKGLNLTLSKYVNNRRDSDETKPLDQLRHHPLFNMHLIPVSLTTEKLWFRNSLTNNYKEMASYTLNWEKKTHFISYFI